MNKVILLGRLTKDPELKNVGEDKNVCEFTIAVNRIGKDADTDFIDCQVWNKQAENLVEYQSKGNRLLVEGQIRTRNFEDSEGHKRKSTRVLASSIQFIDKKSEPTEEAREQKTDLQKDFNDSIEITDDDLPF